MATNGEGISSTVTGTIFDNDSAAKKALYKFQKQSQIVGNKNQVSRVYTDLKGKEVVKENVVYVDGQLSSYQIEKLQTGELGTVKIKKGKISFYYKDRDGDEDRDKEDLESNTLIGDQLTSHVKKHWKKIVSGETIKIRYIVPHRTETVGFKLFKDSTGTCNGRPSIIVKMKPTSIFISALVDPIYFNFEQSDSHRLCSYTGRTKPYKFVGKKWKDLDAHTIYDLAS